MNTQKPRICIHQRAALLREIRRRNRLHGSDCWPRGVEAQVARNQNCETSTERWWRMDEAVRDIQDEVI